MLMIFHERYIQKRRKLTQYSNVHHAYNTTKGKRPPVCFIKYLPVVVPLDDVVVLSVVLGNTVPPVVVFVVYIARKPVNVTEPSDVNVIYIQR
jgi:hypothetical protein